MCVNGWMLTCISGVLLPLKVRHSKVRLNLDVVVSSCLCFGRQIHTKAVPPQRVACMDELSIFIDWDQVSKQNPSAFQLFGSSEEQPVFDIILSALSDGTFLPPVLFFTGTSSHVPEGFPDNVLLEARREGFSEQERQHIWIEKVSVRV